MMQHAVNQKIGHQDMMRELFHPSTTFFMVAAISILAVFCGRWSVIWRGGWCCNSSKKNIDNPHIDINTPHIEWYQDCGNWWLNQTVAPSFGYDIQKGRAEIKYLNGEQFTEQYLTKKNYNNWYKFTNEGDQENILLAFEICNGVREFFNFASPKNISFDYALFKADKAHTKITNFLTVEHKNIVYERKGIVKVGPGETFCFRMNGDEISECTIYFARRTDDFNSVKVKAQQSRRIPLSENLTAPKQVSVNE